MKNHDTAVHFEMSSAFAFLWQRHGNINKSTVLLVSKLQLFLLKRLVQENFTSNVAGD